MAMTPNADLNLSEQANDDPAPSGNDRHAARAGTFAGLFALIGSSCCFLPVLLVNLGVSVGLVERLGFFARHRTLMLWVSAALLVLATIMIFRNGRPRRSVLIWLGVGAIFVGVAYILPNYERELLAWSNRR